MGSSNSRQFGGMIVKFEKPNYYPGEIVEGTVYINMTMGLETRGLQISIEGSENTKFKQRSGKKRVTRTGKNILIDKHFMIHSWQNNLTSIGHYACPFTFRLPNNLPGSFEYYEGECLACIKYIVTAKLLSRNGYDDLTYSSLLIVRTPPQAFSYPTNLSSTKNLTSWCYFDKGSATLNVSYPKSFFTPDEAVSVTCELNNTRCKLKSTGIRFQLVQQIHIEDVGIIFTDSKDLRRTISETYYSKICVKSL
jgi:hypothetical protein